jgi:hypothetical protein
LLSNSPKKEWSWLPEMSGNEITTAHCSSLLYFHRYRVVVAQSAN